VFGSSYRTGKDEFFQWVNGWNGERKTRSKRETNSEGQHLFMRGSFLACLQPAIQAKLHYTFLPGK
jgi:hypothetical protein